MGGNDEWENLSPILEGKYSRQFGFDATVEKRDGNFNIRLFNDRSECIVVVDASGCIDEECTPFQPSHDHHFFCRMRISSMIKNLESVEFVETLKMCAALVVG